MKCHLIYESNRDLSLAWLLKIRVSFTRLAYGWKFSTAYGVQNFILLFYIGQVAWQLIIISLRLIRHMVLNPLPTKDHRSHIDISCFWNKHLNYKCYEFCFIFCGCQFSCYLCVLEQSRSVWQQQLQYTYLVSGLQIRWCWLDQSRFWGQ